MKSYNFLMYVRVLFEGTKSLSRAGAQTGLDTTRPPPAAASRRAGRQRQRQTQTHTHTHTPPGSSALSRRDKERRADLELPSTAPQAPLYRRSACAPARAALPPPSPSGAAPLPAPRAARTSRLLNATAAAPPGSHTARSKAAARGPPSPRAPDGAPRPPASGRSSGDGRGGARSFGRAP